MELRGNEETRGSCARVIRRWRRCRKSLRVSARSDGGVYPGPLGSRRRLVGAQDPVVGVALGGSEPGFTYELARLVDRGLDDVARGLVHVLLEQRAAEVVGAEEEADLPGALALREPRRLHVIHVV